MKIVLTGGGTGGHFYPLIAIAESLRILAAQDHIPDLEMFYFSDKAIDELSLRNQRIIFEYIPSGKLGLSYSLGQKISSLWQVFQGFCSAIWKLYRLYPDVVIAKGGYASVPTSVAAWVLGIPLVIHESDAAPGRANVFLSKFAKLVCVSYAAAASYFPTNKVIHTGQPVRKALLHPATEGVHELFEMEEGLPILWIYGGSLGAQAINTAVIAILPDLLYRMQVIHQTGPKLFDEVIAITGSMLEDHPHKARYHAVAYLDELSIRRIAGVAALIIGRAGSTLFEIASWKIPAIVIPLPVSNADHNKKNAYAYASYGAATVIEQSNLTPEVLRTEIMRIMSDDAVVASMREGATAFATPHASDMIAEQLMSICLSHEPQEVKPDTPISVLIEQQLEEQEMEQDEKDRKLKKEHEAFERQQLADKRAAERAEREEREERTKAKQQNK